MSLCGTEEASTTGGEAGDPGMVVGRRPVLDPGLQVHGYKLAVGGSGSGAGGGTMTEEIAERAGQDGGLAQVFGTKLAFVKPALSFLVGLQQLPELPEQTVIEVDALAATDPAVVDGCRRLVAAGLRLAVHDPEDLAVARPLLDMASYVRLDVAGRPDRVLAPWVERTARAGLTAMAVGVDHLEDLTAARAAGFELFEGRLLSRPVAVVAEALTPSRLACLQMLEKVNDPETSAADLERVVETDPGLSYRLLHVSGLGAAGGLRRQVRSIREATVLLGREWIRRWLILMVVADANQGTPEQLTIAMTRARMSELVAGEVSPGDRDSAFTVGLVSALDLLLGASLSDVVAKLAITDDLKKALLARQGQLGAILSDVLDWEMGTPRAGLRSGIDPLAAERCYLGGLSWACTLEAALRA